MKCPIDVEKKVAEMRQELHPDALVEDAYRAILGAMNGAYGTKTIPKRVHRDH